MKKILTTLLCFIMSVGCFSGCAEMGAILGSVGSMVDSFVQDMQGSENESDKENSENNKDNSDSDENPNDSDHNSGGTPDENPTSGVKNLDFTKATLAKDVTDLYTYVDGCPTIPINGKKPAVLVIPVEFSDATAGSKCYTVDKIKKAFTGGANDTDYYSVHDYYYQSSYGKLDLDITVWDSWFKPKNKSTYYANQTEWEDGVEYLMGDQMVLDEALAYLESRTDLSKFDSNDDAIIDAVVLITTLEIGDDDFHWAYRYWNYYVDDEGYYYEYDGVSANDYLWAPYQFLHEGYDYSGDVTYDDTSAMNTYTFIHEFGHILGAEDYYDTSGETEGPLYGCDVMDSMSGDHNAFTKFHYGWLTTSRLIMAEDSVMLTIEDFSKNGDTVIIANNWQDNLGIYQEYYIVMYYTNNGLNSDGYGYFERDGIVVYHVNAELYEAGEYEGTTYYDVFNNNTEYTGEDEYGTVDNLIEFVKSTKDTFTYVVGDSLSANTKDDGGKKVAYTFTVDALTKDSATLTFQKNK